jgi:hypothetical protein
MVVKMRFLAAAAALAILVTACAQQEPQQQQELTVVPASFDLAVGEQRFMAGLVTPDQFFVTGGSVQMAFAHLGTEEKQVEAKFGAPIQGQFLLADPGQRGGARSPSDAPAAGPASQGRGVYAARVRFDRAGFWEVRVTADIQGDRARTGSGSFEVLEKHRVPAPGDMAIHTANPTLDSSDVTQEAVDSRARLGEIPDPHLHRTTIAQAIDEQRPAMVVFSTPVFCQSRFCGPVTDMVAELANSYGDRAAFIHIEIWRDFDNGVINEAAGEWLFRGGDLSEPWVFLIGADGRIAARWDNVASREEIEPLLQQLLGR